MNGNPGRAPFREAPEPGAAAQADGGYSWHYTARPPGSRAPQPGAGTGSGSGQPPERRRPPQPGDGYLPAPALPSASPGDDGQDQAGGRVGKPEAPGGTPAARPVWLRVPPPGSQAAAARARPAAVNGKTAGAVHADSRGHLTVPLAAPLPFALARGQVRVAGPSAPLPGSMPDPADSSRAGAGLLFALAFIVLTGFLAVFLLSGA